MGLWSLYDRCRAKVEELLDWIPDPLRYLSRLWPKKEDDDPGHLCKFCYPNGDPNEFDIPDDLREPLLEPEMFEYDLKLTAIPPSKWKMVGRNLLNMAYRDPGYGRDAQLASESEDDLPPPPEASEKVQALTQPTISVNLNGGRVEEINDLGDFFYDIADYMEAYQNGRERPPEPSAYKAYSIPEEKEKIDYLTFCPFKEIGKETVAYKKIMNHDVIPGLEPEPWRTDQEVWMSTIPKGTPPPDILVTDEGGAIPKESQPFNVPPDTVDRFIQR